MIKLFPFLNGRDVISDIKKRKIDLKNSTSKNKYALIIEDDFGYRTIEYFICSEKKIQQLLFKKYILLKRKAVKDEESLHKDLELKTKVIKSRKMYEVRLNVGFKLFHRIYYKKLEDNALYIVMKNDMHLTHYLGYYDRAKAFNKVFDIGLKDLRRYQDKNKEDDDKDKIQKVFFNKSVQVRFNYWYKCSYEYDEWDISSIIISARQIKFKKS